MFAQFVIFQLLNYSIAPFYDCDSQVKFRVKEHILNRIQNGIYIIP